MILYPAIDLRDGRAVQLVGGRPEAQRVALPDPVAVARDWAARGFRALHVVDLDAALGRGDNRRLVRAIVRELDIPVQVGGGIRDDDAADALLAEGAARIVVGTRAIEDPEWLAALAARHAGRVVVAADVRGGRVVLRGWTATAAVGAADLLRRLESLPLAGVLVTDVAREGSMAGVDERLFERLVRATPRPLIAAGGIGRVEDLRALARLGAAGAVAGMALYTGALDPDALVEEFAA